MVSTPAPTTAALVALVLSLSFSNAAPLPCHLRRPSSTSAELVQIIENVEVPLARIEEIIPVGAFYYRLDEFGNRLDGDNTNNNRLFSLDSGAAGAGGDYRQTILLGKRSTPPPQDGDGDDGHDKKDKKDGDDKSVPDSTDNRASTSSTTATTATPSGITPAPSGGTEPAPPASGASKIEHTEKDGGAASSSVPAAVPANQNVLDSHPTTNNTTTTTTTATTTPTSTTPNGTGTIAPSPAALAPAPVVEPIVEHSVTYETLIRHGLDWWSWLIVHLHWWTR